jgi:hypothetical protein
MQKIIIKLIVLAVIGTIGGLFYFWQEATKVPDEYIEAIAASDTDPQALPPQPQQIIEHETMSNGKIAAQIDRAKIGQKVAVKLSNNDLNNLVVAKLAAFQTNKQVPAGIKGISTRIKDGKIQAGALVNLAQLTQDGKPGSQAAALSKLTDKLPFLKNREVYIGIVGKPVVDGSRIEFDRDTQIKVGNVNLTISQLADNLGVAPAKIQQAIELTLKQQHLRIDRINLDNNEIAIEGSKK